jgi:indolepyruvate ferredoxin oxidoreductase
MPAGWLELSLARLASLAIEARLVAKLDAVARSRRRASSTNRSPQQLAPDIGIVTCGKAHLDLLESLRRIGLSPEELDRPALRIYKAGLSFPLEPSRILAFADGLREILVIEEKAPVVERQIKELFYNRPASGRSFSARRPADGSALLSDIGELRPSRVMPVGRRLAGAAPSTTRPANPGRRFHRARSCCRTSPTRSGRVPVFLLGLSAQHVDQRARGLACAGRHRLSLHGFVDAERPTTGLIQMGGEGVDWAAHSMFTTDAAHVPEPRRRHVLPLRLPGDPPVDRGEVEHHVQDPLQRRCRDDRRPAGRLVRSASRRSRDRPSRGSEARRRRQRRAAEIRTSRARAFPHGTTFHHRSELERSSASCATRRRHDPDLRPDLRGRESAAPQEGQYPDPSRRIFINTRVCEGCGDCGVQSNCLSIMPVETDLGRKRMVEQASCNKDYSCVNGFCPSFVSVYGGKVRKWTGRSTASVPPRQRRACRRAADARARRRREPVAGRRRTAARRGRCESRVAARGAGCAIAAAGAHQWTGPYDLLVAGVGGTGVVTVGALITMARISRTRSASVLDFMGFAQKGGMVLSYVRIADVPERLNQVRIDTPAGRCDPRLRHGRRRQQRFAADGKARAHADRRQHARDPHGELRPQSGRRSARRVAARENALRRR